MIRKILHKILGIDKVITQLNGRVTLIESIVGINSFMANEGNVGNVGVGSTVPPDVARYQKARDAAVAAGNVGVGSTAPGPGGNVGTPDWDGTGDIDDWARTVEPDWDGTSVANEDQASALYKARATRGSTAPAPAGNVGTDGWPRSDGNVGGDGSV